jgi:hypothetical protein
VAGTVQLFVGLILMVVTSQTGLLNDDAVLFLLGLALAGTSIVWFGVLDRRRHRHWH